MNPMATAEWCVSIPFKRESISKVVFLIITVAHFVAFQFPSNGKAYPKYIVALIELEDRYGFNSLQTGNRIRRSHQQSAISNQQRGVSVKRKLLIAERQQPTAGSHYSIPFKRESISKGEQESSQQRTRKTAFQFPSNGKAYPKTRSCRATRKSLKKCFNSLQTGKHIQSIPPKRKNVNELSFNSLQTGKHIQSSC